MDRPDLDYAGLFDASPNPYLVLDRALTIVGANRAYLQATRRELADIVGRWAWDAFPTDPETLRQSVASFERVLRTGQPDTMAMLRFDIPRPKAEGGGFEERYWSIVHEPVLDAAGEVALVLQHPIDVTELRRLRDATRYAGVERRVQIEPAQSGIFDRARAVYEANLSLQAEGERLRRLFEQAPGFMCVLRGPEHRFELMNAAFLRLVGERDFLGKPAREALPEVAGQGFFKLLDRVYATGEPFVGRGLEITVQAGPGGAPERRIVDFVYQPVTGTDGRVSGIFIEGSDVTEAHRTRTALAAGNARYASLLDAMGEGFIVLDEAFHVVEINSEGLRLDGRPRVEILGRSHWELWPVSVGTPVEDAYRAAMAKRVPAVLEHHYVADGHDLWIELRIYPVPGGVTAFYRDVTERRQGETALRESEVRFRHMADSVPALIWMSDARGQLVFANMHYEYVFGRRAAAVLGQGWEQDVLAEDLPGYRDAFRDAFRARRTFRAEARVRDRNGQVQWLRVEAVPRLDDQGTFLGYTGCSVDITEARLAAEALEARVAARTAELHQAVDALHAEALERERAEEALRQSQKIEAVGQLTGGIAHDFNNMLQAIGGSLEMLGHRVEQGRAAEAARYVESARKTVERAAALTHRLLAFARRQVLQSEPVEPDALVESMAELVRRTVGPGIEVQLRLGGGLWTVLCDRSQLENALLNLAINARDAMPKGGRLTIATADTHLAEADVAGQEGAVPGEYVEITVADTGAGMDEATRARAFEPFFTTKPLGQGTGLGLSQLYGFVRQSDGMVRLDSAPGQGTTVRLYLPRHADTGGQETRAGPGRAGAPPAGAGETVLLVEDETQVRELAAERLRELGYSVLEAADGSAALRRLRANSRVDLLVTDVGLPGGLNGRQVADAARERRPGLPVLFITGYAGDILEGQLAPGMAVIGKPFTLDALAVQVRAMLEAAPTA